MKYIFSILLMFYMGVAISQKDRTSILNSMTDSWRPFMGKVSISQINDHYELVKSDLGDRSDADFDGKLNQLCLVKSLKNHIIQYQQFNKEEKELSNKISPLDLSDPVLSFASQTKSLSYVSDDYIFLTRLKEGYSVEEAAGAGKNNTSMISSYNELFYSNLIEVYKSGSHELKELYLDKISHIFRYYGYTEGLAPLVPYVKLMPESEIKKQVLGLFDSYDHLRSGRPAPDFELPDDLGQTYTLSDFKGKVLVMDVWGTWCSWCIKKMPSFLKMAEKYKDNEDVIFVTISIDKFRDYSHWKYSLPRYEMMGLTNLFACEEKSGFMKNYNITGAPRYIVIDRDGRIVNTYTPGPQGKEFDETILKALENK